MLGSTSTLQLSELTCSRVKPASQTLSLADSGGVERLGISASSAVFSCALSAPSLDVSGSAVIGSSLLLAGPLYLNGVNIMTTIAANAGASISSSSQLSIASLTASADIQGRDVRPTRELHADGAAVLNSTLSVAGNATMSALTVAGTNVLTALSGKQATLTTSSSVSVGSVTTSGYSTMNGLRSAAGQGTTGTGANLRVVGTGDSV